MAAKDHRGAEVPRDVSLSVSRHRLPRTALKTLLLLAAAFVAFDVVLNDSGLVPSKALRRLFNLAREDSLGAWWAVTLTLFNGLVLWLIYFCQRGASAGRSRSWLALALFFTYMAMDDGAKIHERVGTAAKTLISAMERENAVDSWINFPSYTWQIAFGPFLTAMGLFMLVFLWREFTDRRLRTLFVTGLACFAIAVGLDFIEGLKDGFAPLGASVGLGEAFSNHFGRVAEEFLEILGMSCFFVAFMGHWLNRTRIFQLRIEGSA